MQDFVSIISSGLMAGLTYYYNAETKVSVWTKPGEEVAEAETEEEAGSVGPERSGRSAELFRLAQVPVEVQEPEAEKALTPTKVARAASSKSLRGLRAVNVSDQDRRSKLALKSWTALTHALSFSVIQCHSVSFSVIQSLER